MRQKRTSSLIAIVSAIVAGVIFLGGCTAKITQEQLDRLNALYRNEAELQDKIAKAKSETSDLERELSARKKELNDCREKSDFIKKKLEDWPNVWPDWNPEEEAKKMKENEESM